MIWFLDFHMKYGYDLVHSSNLMTYSKQLNICACFTEVDNRIANI